MALPENAGAALLIDGPELIGEGRGIQKPNLVRLALHIVGEAGIVTGLRAGHRSQCGALSARHRIGKPDGRRLLGRRVPVVSVSAQREDPLIRLTVTHQRSQPPFKPRLRRDRPGCVVLAILVVQLSDQVVNDIRKILQIKGAQVFAHRDAQPEFVVFLVQLQTQIAKKIDQLAGERGVDLLPVEHDSGGSHAPEGVEQFASEGILHTAIRLKEALH